MHNFVSYVAFRTMFIFASTALSLLIVMLALNIITVDEVVVILKMPPDAASAFKLVVSRIQEVTGNIMDIISQLLNKLLGWAGVDVDLSKVKVDLHEPASGSAVPNQPLNPSHK